jgi:hypothetical protein
MADQELDLRASMLRTQLSQITSAPEDKSLNQVKEEAIMHHFEQVAEIARMLALQDEIHAVGQTPEECILAAAKKIGWGEITKITDLEGGDPKYTWGRRFYADGTSMKAAGWEVPGGLVMTWWA